MFKQLPNAPTPVRLMPELDRMYDRKLNEDPMDANESAENPLPNLA
jgi:hypothetical protein